MSYPSRGVSDDLYVLAEVLDTGVQVSATAVYMGGLGALANVLNKG